MDMSAGVHLLIYKTGPVFSIASPSLRTEEHHRSKELITRRPCNVADQKTKTIFEHDKRCVTFCGKLHHHFFTFVGCLRHTLCNVIYI